MNYLFKSVFRFLNRSEHSNSSDSIRKSEKYYFYSSNTLNYSILIDWYEKSMNELIILDAELNKKLVYVFYFLDSLSRECLIVLYSFNDSTFINYVDMNYNSKSYK